MILTLTRVFFGLIFAIVYLWMALWWLVNGTTIFPFVVTLILAITFIITAVVESLLVADIIEEM